MGCKCNFIKAEEIIVDEGVISIKVPDDTKFTDCCLYNICLFRNIPIADQCSQIVIMTDNDKYLVFNCKANYWRPCHVKCRSILQLRFFDDPGHFLIEGVKR